MRKYIKILLLSLIFILASILNVYAADVNTESGANITATADKTDVKVGNTVTINLLANCSSGIEGIDSTLEYDKTKLELQSVNVGSKFSNMSGTDDATGKYKLTVISNSTESLTSETFATLTFKVLETAKKDEKLTITLSEIELGDSNDEWKTIADKNVTLTVKEETEKPGTENPSESEKPGTEEPGENEKPGTEKPGESEKPGTNNNQGTGTVDKDGSRSK